MIDKGTITLEAYLAIIENIADLCMASGHKVYMLNHEGADDAELGRICVERIGKGIELVTGLNALEVKGLISTSYLCITSRSTEWHRRLILACHALPHHGAISMRNFSAIMA